MGLFPVDGSKFQAWNSKDRNFAKNKLDGRIRQLDAHTDGRLRILKDMDGQEEKLKEEQERLEKYKAYRQLMEESGAFQLSLTDADVRLMKNKNGFAVAITRGGSRFRGALD